MGQEWRRHATQSECVFDEFECDIPDELLASIDESFLRRKSLKRRVIKTKSLLVLCLTIVTLPLPLTLEKSIY